MLFIFNMFVHVVHERHVVPVHHVVHEQYESRVVYVEHCFPVEHFFMLFMKVILNVSLSEIMCNVDVIYNVHVELCDAVLRQVILNLFNV